MELFLRVNAALEPDIAGCDGRVVVGSAYCVRPRYDWDHPFDGHEVGDGEGLTCKGVCVWELLFGIWVLWFDRGTL